MKWKEFPEYSILWAESTKESLEKKGLEHKRYERREEKRKSVKFHIGLEEEEEKERKKIPMAIRWGTESSLANLEVEWAESTCFLLTKLFNPNHDEDEDEYEDDDPSLSCEATIIDPPVFPGKVFRRISTGKNRQIRGRKISFLVLLLLRCLFFVSMGEKWKIDWL